MPSQAVPLELLSPARNADFGIEAIRHGADAVYIGGPGFGARAAAGNPVAEIERLARFAQRFHARTYVALNTILRDEELERARQIAWQAFDAGADALIIQDMGLLELDLPPIALHASTQTDNRSPEKVRFLEQVGFSQVVLARELDFAQIAAIAQGCGAVLEFFVHGALCVSYSGQCYLSHAHTGRSANRGECAQPCRLRYDLRDARGELLARSRHLLSLKDNDQSANLAALARAGIRSFKIGGRLKDLAYVKNVTAAYRQVLDALIDADPRYRRASSGRCEFAFTPSLERTFNRGSTDYFVRGRQPDIAAFDRPGFVGAPVATVERVAATHFEVRLDQPVANGDGLCFITTDGELAGLRANRCEGARIWPAQMPAGLEPGMRLYRNHDQAFARQLDKPSSTRRIALRAGLVAGARGLRLELYDEDGICAAAEDQGLIETARDAGRAIQLIRAQLGRLGASDFVATDIDIRLDPPGFVPASRLNALRREACAGLEDARRAARVRPARAPARDPAPTYPRAALDYLGNVMNQQARRFYERHGVQLVEPAFEADRIRGPVSLMVTRHCLRYSFNLCPKQVKGLRPDPLQLIHGTHRLSLRFDCRRCEMHVVGSKLPATSVASGPPPAGDAQLRGDRRARR